MFFIRKKSILDDKEKRVREEAHQQWKNAIQIAESYLNSQEYTRQDRIILLKYIMDVVKRDMQAEYIVDLFYRTIANRINQPFFPCRFYDENGNECSLLSDELHARRISLKDDCVLSFPWSSSRMKDNVLHILKNEFKYFANNHWSYYYDGIDVCAVYNGFHSLASGIYKKEGYIEAKVIDIKPLYKHVRTDGVYFYNAHTGEVIEPVQDFRIAILFEISKMKYKLELEP